MIEKASKYGDVNSYSYNKEVIDRLEGQGKISPTEARLFKLLATTGESLNKTKMKYIFDIGFIKDTQNALFSTIAVKVKGDQKNLIGIQYANKVGGNQLQLGGIFGVGGIQWAGTIGGDQEQIIGLIQKANKIGGNQLQGGWIFKELFWPVQYAGKVGKNQYQPLGVQMAGKVGGNQGQLFGIQTADKVKGGKHEVKGGQYQLLGIQGTEKGEKQFNFIGTQYGDIKKRTNIFTIIKDILSKNKQS